MTTYTSNNPDRPYAGKALARMIEQHDVKPYGTLNALLTSCGFVFVEDTTGDKLYRNAATGEVLRMKYINRDAWQVAREPVVEAPKARKPRVSYTVKRYQFSNPALAQDGQGAYLPLDTLNYWREDAAHRALYAAIERAYRQQYEGNAHPMLLDSEHINAKRAADAWTKRHPTRNALVIGKQRVMIYTNTAEG